MTGDHHEQNQSAARPPPFRCTGWCAGPGRPAGSRRRSEHRRSLASCSSSRRRSSTSDSSGSSKATTTATRRSPSRTARSGESAWKPALPLLRLKGERIYSRVAGRRHRPEHVCRQRARSRAGHALRRAVRAGGSGWRARREPPDDRPCARDRSRSRMPAAACSTSIRTASPGQKIEPSFEGLMCAYNYWCAGTDWATSGRPRVRPGDTILVHAGIYKYNRYEYTNNASVNRTVPLDGTYYLTADGTPEMPIAIKAAGDGPVDLRRRRQLRAVRRAGRRLHLLRGSDVPERGDRHPGRHAVHRRREGADRQEEPLRERRRGHLHELRRVEPVLHRRQLVLSAATIRST